MILTHANYTQENLRKCDFIALGMARRILEEYGHTFRDLMNARLVCPFIPAAQFRAILVQP